MDVICSFSIDFEELLSDVMPCIHGSSRQEPRSLIPLMDEAPDEARNMLSSSMARHSPQTTGWKQVLALESMPSSLRGVSDPSFMIADSLYLPRT